MLNIILCDDDKFILKLESERINQEIENNQLNAKISCITTDCTEVFRFLTNNPGNYLYFIDLDFGESQLNGIDIAKRIKQQHKESKIVFVTNHKEMAMKVLSSGVEPFGFLEKTTDMQKLSMGYRKYMQMAVSAIGTEEAEGEEIALSVGFDEKVLIKVDQIAYVESEKSVSHGVTYHTMDGSHITVRDTMDHVHEILGENFIRCHRAILVNKSHMVGFDNGKIKLSSGDEIPCSFRMKNEVKKCMR